MLKAQELTWSRTFQYDSLLVCWRSRCRYFGATAVEKRRLLEEVLVLDLLEVWVIQSGLCRDTLAGLINQHLSKEVEGQRIDFWHHVGDALGLPHWEVRLVIREGRNSRPCLFIGSSKSTKERYKVSETEKSDVTRSAESQTR